MGESDRESVNRVSVNGIVVLLFGREDDVASLREPEVADDAGARSAGWIQSADVLPLFDRMDIHAPV